MGDQMQTDAPPNTNIHEPFTLAERMQQLGEIDHDITMLLKLTGEALKPLSKPRITTTTDTSGNPSNLPPPPPAAVAIDPEAQTAAFKAAMDAFLSTLHSVDVRLKRQILGLEEAGIISLDKEVKATSLAPNGVGNVGSLDVGWLNSRSDKVERDMELELWTHARKHLEHMAEASAGVDGGDAQPGEAGDGEDVAMEG